MALLNGRLPATMLVGIPGTSRRLAIELLAQTVALRADFEAHFGKSLYVTDGYRTYEEQVFLKKQKGPYAATPGTSVHGWGKALDLGAGVGDSFTSPEHLWMRANGPRYGWRHPAWAHNHIPSDGQDEPWHFEGVAVPRSSYRPDQPQEADMPLTQADFDAIRQQAANGTIQALQGTQGQAILTDVVKRVIAGVWLDTKVQPSNTSILQFLAAGAVGGGADGATPAQVEAALRAVLRNGIGPA